MTINDLAKNLDEKATTDLITLDFSKAFDVTPHQKLLHKLDYYGIRSDNLRWVTNFLTKRLQRVCVNGKHSDWKPVLSGTPQGTVLGPHLFLLFINDIHDKVKSTTKLFADDCMLYRPIKSVNDVDILQQDLDAMVEWSQKWGMKFNPKKCESMRVTRKKKPGKSSYNLLGVTLEECKQTKYLGVVIQNDLRWNGQTHLATTKAIGVLSFLRRNFHHCSTSIKEKLYLTLVRPHLDYAVAAWDPYTAKNISSIERVQRQAARFVTSTYQREASVTLLLNSLKWNSLQDRREAHRLSCFHKMLHGQLDIDAQTHIKPKPDRSRRGHSSQFEIPLTRLDVYKNSFFPRTTRAWNDLDSTLVSLTDSAKFKVALLPK